VAGSEKKRKREEKTGREDFYSRIPRKSIQFNLVKKNLGILFEEASPEIA
jgi:hypothetical protein